MHDASAGNERPLRRGPRPTGRIRRLLLAFAWLVLAILFSLGGAGIVAGVGGYPGTAARPELTSTGDAAIEPGLNAATVALQGLVGQVTALGTTARGALTAVVATDATLLSSAIDKGDTQLQDIIVAASALRRSLIVLPGINPDAANPLPPTTRLVLGAATRDRFRTIFDSLDTVTQLPGAWARFTSGSLSAQQLTTLLADHDASTAKAAELGRSGKYAAALKQLDTSDGLIAEAKTLRDQLSNTVDVTTLTEWLDRNAAYDAALRTLYAALQTSGGKVTDAVRKAFDAEQAAQDQLPPDTRGLVVILGEIARGGMNQAIIAIEDARAQLDDALAAASPGGAAEASPSTAPSTAPSTGGSLPPSTGPSASPGPTASPGATPGS